MTLGLIGGVIALLIGIIAATIGSAVGNAASQLGATETAARSGLMVLMSIGAPVLAIVGAVILPKNLNAGLICMIVPAILFLYLGLSSATWLIAGVGALIAGGAYFAWADPNKAAVQAGDS